MYALVDQRRVRACSSRSRTRQQPQPPNLRRRDERRPQQPVLERRSDPHSVKNALTSGDCLHARGVEQPHLHDLLEGIEHRRLARRGRLDRRLA